MNPDHIHDDDGTVEGCPACFADPTSAPTPSDPIYTDMIHRHTEGSDPLVQEPGP